MCLFRLCCGFIVCGLVVYSVLWLQEVYVPVQTNALVRGMSRELARAAATNVLAQLNDTRD